MIQTTINALHQIDPVYSITKEQSTHYRALLLLGILAALNGLRDYMLEPTATDK